MPLVNVICYAFGYHWFVFFKCGEVFCSHFRGYFVSYVEELADVDVVVGAGLVVPHGVCESFA